MLHTRKTAAMQTIQLAARSGYYYADRGTVNADKLSAFVKKMEKKCKLRRSRQAIHKDRKLGRVVVKLVIYPASESVDPNGFCWWLLATGCIEGEDLDDIRNKYLTFRGEYELIRMNKKGQGSAIWTWRMINTLVNYWQDRIRRSIRSKNSNDLRQCIKSLSHMPGFSGIRVDRTKLWSQIKWEWRRAHKDSEELPKLPVNRFKKSVRVETVIRLGQFIKAMNDHDRSSEGQMRVYLRNRASRSRKKERQTGWSSDGDKD